VLSELLLRFRSAGVPGAAGAPAVPGEALDAELAPVFALFEESERAADAIDAETRRQTEAARAEAAELTGRIVADAHANAGDEQAAEAAAWFARADATCADLRTKAAAEVARIDALVPQRLAPLVAELVARVLTAAGGAVPRDR
jgi:flagellar biosynthesis/type III secretory pathway protein FliH